VITVSQAVMSLRPNMEWTMSDDDVEGIIWHTEGASALTQAEVAAEITRLEQYEADKAEADAAATAAAIDHAKSLGFTDSMIAVMYPNLGAPNV